MASVDPIVIVDYDSAWPRRFEAEAARLREGLGALALRIDHVGSTSVPGLAAKPVIDMQLSVKPLLAAGSAGSGTPDGNAPPEPRYGPWRTILEGLGYRYFHDPDFEDYPFLCRPRDWPHTFHLHVCESGSDHERRHLAFRDALRSDAALAEQYAELKRGLAGIHSEATHASRNAYADAKTSFINGVVDRALGRAGPSAES